MIQAQEIELNKLKPNKGQIEGVPTNPRKASKEQIEKLKKSIEETPTMLQLREIIDYDNNGELVIVGGNMRYQALKALGHKTALVKVLPIDTPKETINEFIIKDNAQFGEWDLDLLSMEWDTSVLSDWGVDLNWGGRRG
jgi:ParB-like chromosome segregation protein Spo0J